MLSSVRWKFLVKLLQGYLVSFKRNILKSPGGQLWACVIDHAYFDIDYDVVWEAIANEIPGIILELERMIAMEQMEGRVFIMK
jgi:hypothetical protein